MFSGRFGKFREIARYLMYCFLYLVGNILCMFGIAFSIWFFFISDDGFRYFWGSGSILLIALGYLMMKFGWPHVRSNWDDYL
jgi:hypothetical protein